MICTSDQAKALSCVAMLKDCDGDSCMAWRQEVRAVFTTKGGIRILSDNVEEPTGRGYCGLVYPNGAPKE